MVLEHRGDLVVETTNGANEDNRIFPIPMRLAAQLEGVGRTCVAVTPGRLRPEAMLEHFGVNEAHWPVAAKPVGAREPVQPAHTSPSSQDDAGSARGPHRGPAGRKVDVVAEDRSDGDDPARQGWGHLGAEALGAGATRT
jgi:hypothetical protein